MDRQHQGGKESGGRRGRHRDCAIRWNDHKAAGNQPDQAEGGNRGRNLLQASADANAKPLDRPECQDKAGREDLAVPPGGRKCAAEEFNRSHGSVGRRRNVGQKVGPAYGESSGISQGFAGEDVEAACAWNHRGEFSDVQRAQPGIQRSSQPNEHDERGFAKIRRHRSGLAQDTDSERAADGHRNPEKQA